MNKGWLCTFFICGALLINCKAQSQQHTDLIEYGLKGKVKVATTFSYQILTEVNGQLIPTDSNKWYQKEVIYFNKNGNIDSLSQIVNYQYYKQFENTTDTTFLTSTTFAKNFKYDSKGNGKKGIQYNNRERGFDVISISWPKKNLYIEVARKRSSNEILSVDSVWLNKSGRDSIGCYSFKLEDSLTRTYKYHAFYDKNGDLDYYLEYDLTPPAEKPVTVVFETFIKDDHENVLVTKMTRKSEPELISVKYRTYTYY